MDNTRKVRMKIPLFDIDSTLLVPGNPVYNDAFAYAFKTVYNVPNARKTDLKTDGMIDPQILVEILKLHGIPEEAARGRLAEAIIAMKEYFIAHEHEGEYIPLPGVVDILSELKRRRVLMGLLSGNLEEIGWRKVSGAGLRDYFCFGSFGDLAPSRVDLIPIARIRAKTQCNVDAPLSDFVIIGDSPRDIECAKAGDIEVIAVASGRFSEQELASAGADLVVSSLQEQEKVLRFLQM